MPLSPAQPWPPADAAATPLPTGADIATDVCIVGAGVAGLSVACALAEAGMAVVVLDREGIATGETGRSTAHLTAFFDGGYAGLEKLHGEEKSKLAAASQARALERIAAWSAGADTGFEWLDGWLFPAQGTDGDEAKSICKEAEAAQRAGIAATCVDNAPLPFPTGRSVRFARQAQIDPVAYVAALARRLSGRGGRIFHAAAVSFEDGEPCIVRTVKGPSVLARAVVVATDSPVNNRVAIHTKQFSYRTYVLGLELGAAFPAGIFWDTEEPYHYLRVAQRRVRPPLLMVGGEDHRTGASEHGEHEGEQRFAALDDWARARVPGLGQVVKRWSGQVQEPADGLAYIGRNPGDKHTYVATGFSGNGMTYGAVAAELIGDLVRGVPNELDGAVRPGRITTLGAAPPSSATGSPPRAVLRRS